MTYSIDILIPTRNRCQHLSMTLRQIREAIQSRNSKIQQYRVIVGDNFSSDLTEEAILSASTDFKRGLNIELIYYRLNYPSGLGTNLSIGIKYLKSENVLLLADDDDISDQLVNAIEIFVESEASFAISRIGQPNMPYEILGQTELFRGEEVSQFMEKFAIWPKMPGVFFKKDLLEQCNFPKSVDLGLFDFVPHLFLGDRLLATKPVAMVINCEIAKVRDDYIRQAWFPAYVKHFISREINIYREIVISKGKRTYLVGMEGEKNIANISIDALYSHYFTRQQVYSFENLNVYWRNIARFALGFKTTKEGFPLGQIGIRQFIKIILVVINRLRMMITFR